MIYCRNDVGWVVNSFLGGSKLTFTGVAWAPTDGYVGGGAADSIAFTSSWRTLETFDVPHEGSAHAHVEEEASYDEGGTSPAVFFDQVLSQRREDKRSDATTTHGQAGSQRSPLLEIVGHYDDSRHVTQRQTESRYQSECQKEHFQRVCQISINTYIIFVQRRQFLNLMMIDIWPCLIKFRC